jgi:hypothetical protein
MFANRARNRQTRAAIDRAVAIPARRRQAVQIVPGNFWTGQQTAWTGVSRVDRWQRNQRQNWKSERKARRQFMKDRRRYDRSRNTAFDPGYYSNFGNNYFLNAYRYDRPSWKVRLVQTVIGSFIYRGGGSYDTYDGYDSRRYSPEVYYAEDVPRYHNSPMYVGYSPRYVDGPDYYSDADYEDDGFDLSGMLGQLPIGELIANFAGDGFVSDLLSNLLAQGYDEGFMAGQAALEYGYGDDTYDNPYVFEGGFCDPYSASLGENRELLSEGYTLGYQDALNGRDDYDPYSDGSADLVSVLLSEALGRV